MKAKQRSTRTPTCHHAWPPIGDSVRPPDGDPLHLPGFPVQFLTYRQLAGNNAAALTVAILREWTALGQPTGTMTTD